MGTRATLGIERRREVRALENHTISLATENRKLLKEVKELRKELQKLKQANM